MADEHPKVTLNCTHQRLIKETTKHEDPNVGDMRENHGDTSKSIAKLGFKSKK
jgi:hypothetical protein